jgi:phosphatidylinositol alpha-1,6-mannosyltransferase
LPELVASVGGIQRLGRDTLEAFRCALPGIPLRALVLNDTAAQLAAHLPRRTADGCAGSRLRFAIRAVAGVRRQRPRLALIFHRHLLPLAPLLRAASPSTSLALLLIGVEAWSPPGLLERLALRSVSLLLAISPQTASSFGPSGLGREVRPWPCSLPWDWRLDEARPPRLEPPLRLLSVARLASSDGYKGIDHTIEALARLPGGSARLDIAGDGDDRARLEALARELGVAERVRFHGRVSDPRLRELYAECDVFVLPSSGEGFGIVYLEAMSFARPCVAADAGGAPYVVREGVSGWLVPYARPDRLAERLREISRVPAVTRRVGLSARRLVETEFSFAAMTERARELFGAAGGKGCASST